MTTPAITAGSYQQLQGHGYAGPASELLPETVEGFTRSHPDWNGNYWFMHGVAGVGTVLSPVNITPNGTSSVGAQQVSAPKGVSV